MKLFNESLLESTPFLEVRIWEYLINVIEIKSTKQNKLVLCLNTYRGILREVVNSVLLNIDLKSNILFEMYMENKQNQSE